MRKTLIALNTQRGEVVAQMESLLETANSEDRAFTDDEQAKFDAMQDQVSNLDRRIDNEKKLLDNQSRQPVISDPAVVAHADAATKAGIVDVIQEQRTPKIEFPSRRGTMKCFQGENGDKTAFRFGMWLKAISNHAGAIRYCQDHGIRLQYLDTGGVDIGATYSEGSNTAGGYLVLPEFDSAIIRLVEAYGLARQYCRVVPMGSDTKMRDRRTGGLTAYFVGESDAGTESTGSWDQVQLIAKKLMVLTRITNELNSDAIINVADNIAQEVAYAFAQKEDQCLFIGDGTSTYGGIVGLTEKLTTINGVDNGGGLVLAAGNLMSEVTLANLNSVIAALPDFAETSAAWYCHKFFWASVMQRLEAAAGGNTLDNLVNGNNRKAFLGEPVNTTNTMPKTDSNSQILALYGDLAQAVDFGDRAQITMAVSDSATVGSQSVFERDQLAFRATERFDINVHDIGTSTTAGPVIGLIAAAS